MNWLLLLGLALLLALLLAGCASSLVSRVVRKQVTSGPVWGDIVWCLNHPRENAA